MINRTKIKKKGGIIGKGRYCVCAPTQSIVNNAASRGEKERVRERWRTTIDEWEWESVTVSMSIFK